MSGDPELIRLLQRENARLQRNLDRCHRNRSKAQGRTALLRERLTRTLDRLDHDPTRIEVDYVIHTIRKELES